MARAYVEVEIDGLQNIDEETIDSKVAECLRKMGFVVENAEVSDFEYDEDAEN